MIKAIETVYNGYKFRSRLEARWAVFFDSLGIDYQYEKEGFNLGGVFYLPDFWLPKQQCFIEIKGEKPSPDEDVKAARLSDAANKPVFIFFGDCWFEANDGAYAFFPGDVWDNCYAWCECLYCPELGIEFEGRSARLPCKCAFKSDSGADRNHNGLSIRLQKAYTAARQARFEHGAIPFIGQLTY